MIAKPGDLGSGQPLQGSRAKRFWTVADLLSWTEGYFAKLEMPTPRLDAELLLARAMEVTRLELYTGYRRVVEEPERARFRSLVERRASHEPVAYILGVREFYSLELEVTPAVLIPRPETEHLVDRVLEEVRGRPVPLDESPESAAEPVAEPTTVPHGEPDAPAEISALDLGTGSGNISVALLMHVPTARVVAVDLSADAIAVAERNARRHGVHERLELVCGDLFDALESEARDAAGARGARFDVVVSNPPYVALAEYPNLMKDVRDFEPSLALLDRRGEDGLGFYREIAARAPDVLVPGGLLALEVGATQARHVEALLEGAGWERVRIASDYAGIPRVVTARTRSAG